MNKLQTITSAVVFATAYSPQSASAQCKPHDLVNALGTKYESDIGKLGNGTDDFTIVIDVPGEKKKPALRLEFIVDTAGNRNIFMREAGGNNFQTTGYEYNPSLDPECKGTPTDLYLVTLLKGTEKREMSVRTKKHAREFIYHFTGMITQAYNYLVRSQNVKGN